MTIKDLKLETPIIRKVTQAKNGRTLHVTIPREIADQLSLSGHDYVQVYVEGKQIRIQKLVQNQ